jgi:hypothetical protein
MKTSNFILKSETSGHNEVFTNDSTATKWEFAVENEIIDK